VHRARGADRSGALGRAGRWRLAPAGRGRDGDLGPARGDARRLAAAAAALRTIGDTGREALGQMRRLLGVLRAEPAGGATLAPQPGTAQLDALVEQVAGAGLPAHLSVQGEPRALPGTIDVALYRVVQEALTNVLKHARAVSRVDVVLRFRDDAVEVRVRDDGRGAQGASDDHGHGLVGMRERVDLHDGTLTAGPHHEGGFEVRASIPTERVGAPA
jgi:signal transduction histidine kinase